MIIRGGVVLPLSFYGGIYMAKEYTRDASEYGQMKIVEALEAIGASVSTDKTLAKEDVAADAKAVGDAIGSIASNGNYVKKSGTKNVCENISILDTRAKTNADAITTNGTAITTLNGLISDDGTTKMLFGMVVTIDAETGAVTLAEPVVESAET